MTSPDYNPPNTFPASLVFFRQKNKNGQNEYLLHQRQNTGYDDNKYSTAGGKVEKGETYLTAAIREVKMETGLDILVENLKPAHLILRVNKDNDEIRPEMGFVVEKWQGTPQNNEPEKHSDWEWYAASNLPKEMSDYVRQSIEKIEQGIIYSEIGG